MPPDPPGRHRFQGIQGYSSILTGPLMLLRALFFGSIVAERNYVMAGIPGMNLNETDKILDPEIRRAFKERENKIISSRRSARKQDEHMIAFCNEHKIDLSWTSEEYLDKIGDAIGNVYRLVVFNYHNKSKRCSIRWASDWVRPKVIYLVYDGTSVWDAVVKLSGIFERDHFCEGCLELSNSVTRHRCAFTCKGCAAQKSLGNCNGNENIKCSGCNFFFQTKTCYDTHKLVWQTRAGPGSRCDTLKFCESCRSVYRARAGPHSCARVSAYCSICRLDKPTEHDCHWAEITQQQKDRLIEKQKNFRWCFYDVETTQTYLDESGKRQWLPEQYCTTIVLIKVCSLCASAAIHLDCSVCKDRVKKFTYKSAVDNNFLPPTEDDYAVIDEFCEWIIKDSTMNRRFDSHLILKGFMRSEMFPDLVINKGSTLITVEYKLRGGNRIVLKDSYCVIPMALSAFEKAFDLRGCGKGQFPHYTNMRCNWNKIWPDVPPKDDFGYKNMKPDAQKVFDEWYLTMQGKEWDQDYEIQKYCLQDVIVLMRGCLQYREIMMKETTWCPFSVANTVASYSQFVLRANYLNAVDFPYLPEAGYGSVRQSDLALRVINYMEESAKKCNPPNILQHARSPHGEKVFPINGRRLSVDVFDGIKTVFEVLGCYFHGCLRCFSPDTRLVGGETARSLNSRTMERIRILTDHGLNVLVSWECHVKAKLRKKGNESLALFFKMTEVISRLRPRDALYGGRVEVFRSLLRSSADIMIYYLDIVSMYPAVMALREYPLGQPTVITSGFEPITGTSLPYRGLIKLRVLAPRNLMLPVLPFRAENCLFFSLCASCANAKLSECNHETEKLRCWVGTYTTVEVELALREGYKVLAIYEVWHWDKWSDEVYKGYFKQFIKLKYAASGFPDGVETPEEKSAYCKRVSRKLGLNLQPHEVFDSPARRTVSKLSNNSTWGKSAEKAIKMATQFVSPAKYLQLVRDANVEIKNFKELTRKVMLVNYQPLAASIKANRFSAVHHAALVTSYARVLLFEIIKKVGSAVGYCDTDSIMFDHPRGEVNPLADLLTGELGDLSDETPKGWDIKEVVLAGCKNYSMQLSNDTTGEEKIKTAFRGFPKDAATLDTLNHDRVSSMVFKRTPDVVQPITRPTFKRTLGHISTYDQTKLWQPVSKKRATRGVGELEIKVPFGYVPDYVEDVDMEEDQEVIVLD